MVKVGDSLIVTGERGHFIPVGSKVTVVEVDNNYVDRTYCVESESGLRQWVYNDDLRPISPPQKITQNGYEYSLVGPVKPEWLVDGAWVVSRITGTLYKTKQVGNDRFQALKGDGYNNSGNLTAEEFSAAYRPHEPKDWKWGNWAMYDGKRVFVFSGLEDESSVIAVTFPNIDSSGYGGWDKNHDFIESYKLTPTF